MSVIPVLISIRSNAHRDEAVEDETMTMLTSGIMEVDDERAVIRYEESIDQDAPPQQVEVAVQENTATMTRSGAYGAQMVFRMGSRFDGQYHTPFGTMDLGVYCTRLAYDLGDDGGTVEISYQMDLNGRFAAMHDITMNMVRQNDA